MSTEKDPASDLIALLDTRDAGQGALTADALGRIGASVVEPLLRTIHAHLPQHEMLTFWAAEALIRIGFPAVPSLLTELTDEDSFVRGQVVNILGHIGDQRVLEPLIRRLLDDPVADVRVKAAEALGRLGDDRAIGPLVTALGDPGKYVGTSAQQSLVAHGEHAIDPLITTLEDRGHSDQARMLAASALGKLGTIRAFEPLRRILLDRGVALVVRQAAAVSLAELNRPEVLDILLTVLLSRDEERSLRQRIALLITDPRAFDPLLALFQQLDDDAGVRSTVAWALHRIGGDRAIEPLIGALGDALSEVRVAAAQALGRCDDVRALQALEEVRDHESMEWGMLTSVQKSIVAIRKRLGLDATMDD